VGIVGLTALRHDQSFATEARQGRWLARASDRQDRAGLAQVCRIWRASRAVDLVSDETGWDEIEGERRHALMCGQSRLSPLRRGDSLRTAPKVLKSPERAASFRRNPQPFAPRSFQPRLWPRRPQIGVSQSAGSIPPACATPSPPLPPLANMRPILLWPCRGH
jgi:hypothetical protein